MKDLEIKILNKQIEKEMLLPQYSTVGSAGMDIRACINEPIVINRFQEKTITTGIALYIKDKKVAGILLPRSGLGKKGLILSNTIGLIDSDYQGEIKVSLFNRGKREYTIFNKERIAQMIIIPVYKAKLKIVKDFSQVTKRNISGFGHTGKY